MPTWYHIFSKCQRLYLTSWKMNIVLNMDKTELSVQDASTIIIPILMENVNLTSLDVFTVMEFVFLANLHFRTTLPTIFVKFLTVFKLISQVVSTVNILSNWTKTKNVSWTIAWDGIVKVVFNANLFTISKTENVLTKTLISEKHIMKLYVRTTQIKKTKPIPTWKIQ